MNVQKHYSKIPAFALLLLSVVPAVVLAQDSGSIFSLQDILWTFVSTVFGTLLGLAGIMLDGSLELFVTGFADTYISMGQGVDLAWVMIRDIFNLTFIFGLVWIGMKMILGSDDSGAKRNLIYLIMAALLVNFSLFFTKFIVDFTNILASQILQSGFSTEAGINGDTAAVSSTFMQIFNLSSTFNGDWINDVPNGGGYMYIFGSAIIFLIGAFCFFAGAFMIALRFVALCIYMVFSPIMFLGWVFPQLQSQTSKYWSGFLGRAFFAPAYVILIYLAAYIMSVFPVSTGNIASALNPAASGDTSQTAGILINFMLVAMFLIASVVVGNKLGADGASVVMRTGNNIRGRVQRTVNNTAAGTGRLAVRQTAGYAAQGLNAAAGADRRRMDSRLATMSQGNALQRWGARTIDGTYGSALRAGERATIAGSETLEQKNKRIQDSQQKFNTKKTEDQRSKELGDAYKSFEDNKKIFENSSSTPQAKGMAKAEMEDMEKKIAGQIAKMSADELSNVDTKQLKSQVMAKNLTDAQIKALAESGKYVNDDIKGIKDAKNDGIISGATAGLNDLNASAQELELSLENLAKTISNLSQEQLESIGADKLKDEKIAANLTSKQIEKLRDSGKMTTGDIAALNSAREAGLAKIATDGSLVPLSTRSNISDQDKVKLATKFREKMFTQSAQDAGKLPPKVFAEKAMAPYITPAALTQRVRNGLTTKEVSDIETNIKLNVTGQREKTMWQNWQASTTEGSRFNF